MKSIKRNEEEALGLKIDYLVDQKHFIPELSYHLHQEFGYLAPHRYQKDFEDRMLSHCNKNCLPMTFIAVQAEQLMGTFSLRQYDMDTHKHLSPWIGSVFVHPSSRNKGIGTQLMLQSEILCKEFGIETLYLFTPNKQAWYLKLGWQPLEETTFNDHPVTIMKKNLQVDRMI